jgi:hypothetical protein
MAISIAAPAAAYGKASGFGAGFGMTSTLSAPAAVTVPAASTAPVPVSWTASAGSPTPAGYFILRRGSTTSTAACASSPAALVTGTSCSDAAVPDGTYTYVVTAVYRSWTAASPASGSVVVLNATQLAFSVQPSNAASTVAISPAVQVSLRSASGASVSAANVSVSVSLGTNPATGTLSGTLTALTNSSGTATFATLAIDKAGAGYTLTAGSPGLTGATSSSFTITVGAAAKLQFTTSPTDSFAGTTFYNQPVVVIQDAGANTVTASTASVTMAITNPAGALLTCAAKSAVAGVATFSACSIDKVGTYTLTAQSTGLAGAVSSSFAVVAAPTHVAWSAWTSTGCSTPPAGSSFTYAFNCGVIGGGTFTSYVSLTDGSGNPVANLGAAVVVTLTAAHGSVSAATVTIAHGQSASTTNSKFTAAYPLLVVTDTVTAAATSLVSATAALHTLL